MEEQQIQNTIEAYIKNNLSVELDSDYSLGGTRQSVIVRVYLGEDEVSSDSVYIDKE